MIKDNAERIAQAYSWLRAMSGGKLTSKQVEAGDSIISMNGIEVFENLIGMEVKQKTTGLDISEKGFSIIKEFEGFESEAYLDTGGVWTIGHGTCLERGTKIRMADGSSKPVEDIFVGDYVAGVDGKPKKVLARQDGYSDLLSVKGYDYEYKVTPDHSLVFHKVLPKYNEKYKSFFGKTGEYFTKEAKHFIDSNPRMLAWEARCSFNTEYKDVAVDPYILGSWLGDGIKATTVQLCQQDNEVLDYWKKVYHNHHITTIKKGRVSSSKVKGKPVVSREDYYIFRVKKDHKGFHKYNLLHRINSKTGKVLNRAVKRIPEDYLTNSEDVRLQVLAGIIDTDGHACKRKSNKGNVGSVRIDMSVVNLGLIRDIKMLAQSLGFCVKEYSNSREGYPNDFIILDISGELSRIPLKVKYKRDNLVDKIKPNRIQSVEKSGKGFWVGHTVEDSLLILENGVITHNTKYPNGVRVRKGDKCTKEQAESWLKNDSKWVDACLDKYVKVSINQNQFDALASLVYNIGETAFIKSTLLRLLNDGDFKGAADQFDRWVNDNGKRIQGLVNRRAKEKLLFLTK